MNREVQLCLLIGLVMILAVVIGCNSKSPKGLNQGGDIVKPNSDTDFRDDPHEEVDSETDAEDEDEDTPDPNCSEEDLLCFKGDWVPTGRWGAEGDQDDWDDGSDGYKNMMWKCLICDPGSEYQYIDTFYEATYGYTNDEEFTENETDTTDQDIVDDAEPKVLYLSADDSNSQSSPVLVRSMIENRLKVPSSKIRIWEFLNYYSFSYEPPGSAPINVVQQLRPNDMREGLYALQIGVQGRRMTEKDRRPFSITLVLDTSGSMMGKSIGLLKQTCKAIASSLVPGDRISMVTWNTIQTVVLDSLIVEGPNDYNLLRAINRIQADGATNLHSGLVTGYQLAEKNFVEDGLNRVVLISDGMANVGITDEEIIAEAAKGSEGDSIYLVGVGVGNGNQYNDELMNTVTDWGKGAALFIDSKHEAYRMFAERFLATMEVVALDVEVEMTLPPYFDMEDYMGEEYSEDANKVEPQHLAPNDAMIYQQILRTSRPEEVFADYTIDLKVTYTDALSGKKGKIRTASKLQEMVDSPCYELRKGDAIVIYAQTLGKMYNLLGEGEEKEALNACREALVEVRRSAVVLNDKDLKEIAGLLETYCQEAETWYDGDSSDEYSPRNMWNCPICINLENTVFSVL
ncbi:MAG: VWA domain-containing protein [Proteobacteria bacterium]|nr:VWA domain-containing protein [Pseudomonadota bacterium]